MKPAQSTRYVRLLGLSMAAATCLIACSTEPERDPVADELTTQLQAELDAAATVNPATAASVRPVRPLLKCVDKLSSTSYRAHVGYTNSSTASIPVPVGFFNRFYPDPASRGQPTTFLSGSHPDLLQIAFSSNSLAAWVLGSSLVVATRTTALCPTGTGGTTGSGGAATGGRGGSGAGGRGGGGGVVGVGGSPGVGGAMCPSSCDDRNPCTTDICNASTAFKCSNVAARDGTVCDDGNNCTVSDLCVAGACVPGIPKVCNAIDQCHVTGTCDPTSGACSIPIAANNTPCNDGSQCTAVDLCQGGVCVGTMPKICTASDQCHVAGVCVAATGLCPNPAAADGTACNDGNACTIGDACRAGACTPAQTLTASHCAGVACDQCSFDVGSDVCSLSPEGCNNCVPSTDGCDAIADPNDRQLCEDAYGCFTDPARSCVVQGDALGCWCGTSTATCDTDNTGPTKANGPCLDFVTRAARLTPDTYDAATIEQRLIDPDFPLGRAVNLVNCRGTFCSPECGVQ